MIWIEKFLPFIGIILGWGLAEFGKFSSDKKAEKSKLKKLLFNLLEIRELLNKEINLKNYITIFYLKYRNKAIQKFGTLNIDNSFGAIPLLTDILKDKIIDVDHIKMVESNIDVIINELAEIYPIFAFELNGRYKLKERIEKTENYFKDISNTLKEDIPTEVSEWIYPKISQEFIEEMDSYIILIAKKIGRKTKNVTHKKLTQPIINDDKLDEIIKDYFDKVETLS